VQDSRLGSPVSSFAVFPTILAVGTSAGEQARFSCVSLFGLPYYPGRRNESRTAG
jgi:hypothetical protein